MRWGLITIATGGCAAVPSEHGAHIVGALTSGDSSWRRLAFERRHGGCIEGARVGRIEHIAAELTGRAWTGPEIRVAILGSRSSNAFVLPSGHIYVTAGLLETICSDDHLAAVVAHELGHLADLSAFDRLAVARRDKLAIETDADDRAVAMLLAARYDPAALPLMIARLAEEQPAGWAQYRCSRLNRHLGQPSDDGSNVHGDGSVACELSGD